MTDRITLTGISARGRHGVLDWEKQLGQPFVADVVLEVDLARPGESDDLAHTVNYAAVAAEVVEVLSGEPLDLIEAVAERVARRGLAYPLVEAVEVTVHKPDAPVGVPFTDVSVHVRRERDTPVVVALGANLGDVQETLEAAVRAVGDLEGVRVDTVSPLVETDPVGGPEQPAYLNAVLLAHTRLAPHRLLASLHRIEAAHGRTRETRWGARTLDLDLIQYGDPDVGTDVVSDDPGLMLPHPRAAERAFVLTPWLRADPEARLRVAPGEVADVARLLAATDADGVRPGPEWSAPW
ncbi:2-amino-4-hydroxy-6-hydroxymethyldihydropteridine diphosphokinase [Oryzihumus leptocrescens]|uniref:Bifunctional folate synthesis protein n=1 Tax=Oryzihumus leptocrescens TaxID=297536 RepID=A0A542ZEF1_9MICO|nr:2-amino-4-hydroxy-6-hydroxymethyldihydropteridine diphosphokinase [Oryzihumus leptocrescens]TQL58722.1 dihydroneopterin aldolase/2-amino-4-hydroxy-6-hydroxymethyldihydropteridine diphosphokinase [Oryzihumus leptocrescens]